MMRDPKLLYVLADGARARFVERLEEPRSFATIDEIDARGRLRDLRRELRASPPARTQQSGNVDRRHAVGPDDHVRRAKADFIDTVAERATTLMRAGEYQGVVIAAPDRLLDPLRQQLENAGAETVAIKRDLTKTPDSALGDWLEEPSRQVRT